MKNTQRGFIPILILVIVAAVAIGGGTYYVKKKNANRMPDVSKSENSDEDKNATSTMNRDKEKTLPTKSNGSLRALLALGGANKCTVNSQIGSSTVSQGTVYVANGMMRGDFDVTVSGAKISSHMINDGMYMYSWSGNQGTKILVKGVVPPVTGNTKVDYRGMDIDAKVDYNCGAWTKDESLFKAPAGINFVDMQEMMNNMKVKVNIPKVESL